MDKLFINQRWMMAWLWVGSLIVGVIAGGKLFLGDSTLRVIPAGAAVPVEIETIASETNKTTVSPASITELADSPPFLLIGRDSPLHPAAADFCLLGPQTHPPVSGHSTSQNALPFEIHTSAKSSSYQLASANDYHLTLHTTGFVSPGVEGQALPLTACLPPTPQQAQFHDASASM